MNASSSDSPNITGDCFFLLPSDLQDLRGYFIGTTVVMSLVIIPTIILNALVLVGVWHSRPLHTPSNVLLCGLAASDLGTGFLVMPISLVTSISYSENFQVLWCQARTLSNIISAFFVGVSFVTITLVSVDRMIALKFHLRYASIVTIGRILRALIALWLAGVVLSSSHLWFVRLLHWATVIVFFSCLVLCTFNNATIFLILRRHRVDIQRLQVQIQSNQGQDSNMAQRRNTSSTMLWVFGLFVLCYAPFLIIRISKNLTDGYTKASFVAFTLSYFLVIFNSFLNPILYCMKMRPIRKSMLAVIPNCLKPCQKK